MSSFSIDENLLEKFSIYPNPRFESFNFQLNSASSEEVFVNIYDITGRLIKDNAYSGHTSVVQNSDVYDLSRGAYIAKVDQGEQPVTKKLII